MRKKVEFIDLQSVEHIVVKIFMPKWLLKFNNSVQICMLENYLSMIIIIETMFGS